MSAWLWVLVVIGCLNAGICLLIAAILFSEWIADEALADYGTDDEPVEGCDCDDCEACAILADLDEPVPVRPVVAEWFDFDEVWLRNHGAAL